MRYLSLTIDGVDTAAVLEGNEIVPLRGIREIGAASSIEQLQGAERDERGRRPLDSVFQRALVPDAGKVFCIGLNYHSHIEETGRDLPEYPVLFPKYASSLIPANADIQLPPESSQIDYEGEMAVVIGRSGRRIAESEALEHVLGYAVANDVTMRDFQYKTHQWLQGKAWDASTPLGPSIVTADEFDPTSAGIRTVLNGITVQESDLGKLIFSIPRLIAVISAFTRLHPGDIILTGTPSGVGFRRDPQLFLADGDEVSVEIDGIGRITNRATAEAVEAPVAGSSA
jgi:acylpyruvate hydrolase